MFDAGGRQVPAKLAPNAQGLSIEVDDSAAQYPLLVDPMITTASWTGESNQTLAWFGFSVAGAGDVNADGFADVIVGSSAYDGGQTDEGRAYLFLGSAAGLAPTAAWTAESNQAGASFGHSVASAGDVNGDGRSDVIVGAPNYSNGQSQEGRAYVYLGTASGLAAAADWTVESDQMGAQLGLSVASAGDVDRDGFSDVLVGAPYFDNGQIDEGRAALYQGSATGVANSPVWTGEGDQVSAYYGTSVAGAGDVNRDGFMDVVVGAPYYDNGNTDEGRGFAYLGTASGLIATPWAPEPNQDTSYFGSCVAGAGDVNGDGFADVIVAAPNYDDGAVDNGRASVFYGSNVGLSATANWTIFGGAFGAQLSSVAGAGDVNGDGFADVVIGIPGTDDPSDSGLVRFAWGSSTGLGGGGPPVNPGQAGAKIGTAVAAAGDVNGDGLSDVIAGAPYYDAGHNDEGRAYLYMGAVSLPWSSWNWTINPVTQGQFGQSVASAGDVDGDGFAEFLVGAPSHTAGQSGEGAAFLYAGSSAGPSTTASWSFEANQANAAVGMSVAGAGDVNGDGYADVIVGAPSFDNGETDEGRAFLFLGSESGLATSPAWTSESNQASARYGWSVASAGDVNGDGFGDVIVGSPWYDNGQNNEGRAYVFLGSAGGLAASPAWTVESDLADQDFASSVASAGDVNGDGFSDVIVGSPLYDNGHNNEGRAQIFMGSALGPSTVAAWQAESDAQSQVLGSVVASAGDVNGDGYSDVLLGGGNQRVYHGGPTGPSTTPALSRFSGIGGVASAGDINGDGYGDIVIGAQNSANVQMWLGSATGLPSGSVWTLTLGATSTFGNSVASGDTNGDGLSDVIVGAVGSADVFGFLGNTADVRPTPAFPLAPQARRPGTVVPIAPLGVAATGAFDVRLLGRTPFGRGRVRIEVELKPIGDLLDGTGLVTSIAWEDTGIAGVDLAHALSGLLPNTGYHWRARLRYEPALAFKQNWSHWVYGGTLGEAQGLHLRSSCVGGDDDGDGTPNCSDGCPVDQFKVAPGLCGCGTADTDTDGDLTPNCNDQCPMDPGKIVPGACGCGTADTDGDGDGTPNCNDQCPSNPAKIAPGQCGCATADTDSDGDGTANCNDQCPNNAPKIVPGICGCTTPDTDSDGDGTANCNDQCPNDPGKTAPGVCGCGTADADSDGDGTLNCNDGCPNNAPKTAPGQCGCANPDTDSDGDGTANCVDGCPMNAPKIAPGQCGCPNPDTDSDNDGTANCNDNCPSDPNKTVAGICGCGTPETDSDSDGTPNCNDQCPSHPAKIAPGQCGCATADTDSDGDGTANCNDQCPNDLNKTGPGVCGCGVSDADSDGDGTVNCNDDCPNDEDKIEPGECGCGVADADTDGDNTLDCNDGCPNDPAKITTGVCGCGNSDADGDSDGVPNCNDQCPADPGKAAPGVCGCGNSDADADGDGTLNCNDGCPADPDKTAPGACGCGAVEVPNCGDACPNDPNKVSPGQCGCGVADTDSDSDATPDCNDGCPNDPLKTAAGTCGCGDSDADSDNDGTPNCTDGCPADAGKTDAGVCGCGVADDDSDGDATPDCNDGCPGHPDKIAPGACGCDTPDTDTDADGTADCDDLCPNNPLKTDPGVCGCDVDDSDGDGDGVLDCVDACPNQSGNGADGCPTGAGGSAGSAGSAGTAGGGSGGAGNGGTGNGGTGNGGTGNGGAGSGGMSTGGSTASGGSASAGEGGMAPDTGGSAGANGEAGASGSPLDTPDAGSPGGTTGTGGGNAHDDGGCGCRFGSRSRGSQAAALVALFAIALVRRRRGGRAMASVGNY